MANHPEHETSTASRLSVLESKMETLLGNGRPGVIEKLEKEIVGLNNTVSLMERTMQLTFKDVKMKALIFVMVIVATIISSGSGTISIHSLLQLLK